MVVVKKSHGESDESLIRRFSRAVLNQNLLPEIKRRGFYLKPSAARQYKQQERRRLKKVWA